MSYSPGMCDPNDPNQASGPWHDQELKCLDGQAESLEEPQDMPYGDRRCMVKDPGGNIWQIATHNEEAFQEFIRQRSAGNV